ncbi:MAG: hypothetical protein H0W88_01040 [Parachlamydiaceae bacterium]|nr:hypothetical protein [Parachlamydiaceae bacterium]
MQKGHKLEFSCQSCKTSVCFSIFELDKMEGEISCPECSLIYDFSDEVLRRQLRKFEGLCRQIQQSDEILSNTSVGIYIGDREIKIPYKLLLTRLNSTLDLMIGEQPLTISFRIEPSKDVPVLE